MSENNEFPFWDHTNPNESLIKLHQWTVAKAHERIEWYGSRSKSKKSLSQFLRIITILCVGAGGLCPLIDATGIFINADPNTTSFALGKWGYVFIALAGAIVGFDKFFGLSTGWMRFIVTQLSLERLLQEFHFEWVLLYAQYHEQQNKTYTPLLQKVKDFGAQMENLVKEETDAWVREFQSNLAELRKTLKTETKIRKLGSIKVIVSNAKNFDMVVIMLNNYPVKELVGIPEGLIENIPPGSYEIIAIGKKDKKEFRKSKVAEVQPGAMASVEITLPQTPAAG